MIASNPFSDGLETEFGLRAAADVNNTGGEAFISFAAGHFFPAGLGQATTALPENSFHSFCKQMKFF